MNVNENSKSGSRVFEKFSGNAGQVNQAYDVSESRPPRISFEKFNGSSISVAYGRVSLIRHHKRDIYVSLGKLFIHLQGDHLRPLYDTLQQERVTRIREQPAAPEDDFLEDLKTPIPAEVTAVRKITWTDELEVEG